MKHITEFTRNLSEKQKQWLWFAGLWFGGLFCVLTLSFFIKGIIALI